MDELDDILEGEEQPVDAVEAPQEPEAQPEVAGQPRDGEQNPKGEDGEPPAPEDKAKAGREAAIVAERRKRQEVEGKLEKLERQIAEMQQPPQPEQPPVSLWEDDQKWQEQFGGKVVSTAVEQANYQSRLTMSEMMVAQADPDFANIKEDVIKFVGSNPVLNQQVQNSTHPWDFAVKAYRNNSVMQELGATDLESLKAKLREEVAAEAAQSAPKIPQSLAGNGGRAGSPAVAAGGGMPSLQEILDG